MRICEIVPVPEDLLALAVEEVSGVLLVHLNSRPPGEDGEVSVHYLGFCNNLQRNPEYKSHVMEVRRALIEAWAWLASEGFIVNDLTRGADYYFLTRRARQISSTEALSAYRKANLLPHGQLHPSIATKVYPAFLRGEYDTAVFQAMREVEVAVRQTGKFSNEIVGVNLMREAFRPEKNNTAAGPLADAKSPVAEQEAMASLFAGAIGLYKNPLSHRNVPTDATGAAEVIMFASQLLRVVDCCRLWNALDPESMHAKP